MVFTMMGCDVSNNDAETTTETETLTETETVTETETETVTETETITETETGTETETETETEMVSETETDKNTSTSDIDEIDFIGMTYGEVKAIMGSEGTEIGSGAIIFQWELDDGRIFRVWLNANHPNDPDDCYVVTGYRIE